MSFEREKGQQLVVQAISARSRRLKEFTGFRGFGLLVSFAAAALILWPTLRVVGGAFWFDGAPSSTVWVSLSRLPIGRLLWDTFTIVTAAGAIALVFGTLMAWLNERTDASLGLAGATLPLVPFLLPPVAGAIGWMTLLAPQSGIINNYVRVLLEWVGISLETGPFNIHSRTGIVLVYAIYMIPYVFLMMSAAFRSFDGSMEEQARVCGASTGTVMRTIVFPALRPAAIGSLLLLSWYGLSLFSIPFVLGPRAGIEVISVRIVRLIKFEFPAQPDAAVGLSLIILVTVALLWLLMRKSVRSNRSSTASGKGSRQSPYRLGAWRTPARMLLVGYVVIGGVLPLLALITVSLTGYWSPTVRPSEWGLRFVSETLFSDRRTQSAIRNSLGLAAAGATVGVALAALMSNFLRHDRSRLSLGLDAAIKLPATLPNIVLAVGFILVFAGPPFRLHGTLTILFLAYFALYIPLASTSADAAVGRVGSELTEAGAISGAPPGRVFWTISLPIMVPGLISGWALLFALMLGDLNASAILSGGRDNIVVGFRLLELYSGAGSFAATAALSTALALLSGGTILGVMFLSRRFSRSVGGIVEESLGASAPSRATGGRD